MPNDQLNDTTTPDVMCGNKFGLVGYDSSGTALSCMVLVFSARATAAWPC
jgi:hypothetical protein